MSSSVAHLMVRALHDLDQGGGMYLSSTLFDVARKMKATTHSHMNTARVLSECFKVLQRPRSTTVEEFLYDPTSGCLHLHILDRACIHHLRIANGQRVRRALVKLVQSVYAKEREGRFYIPSRGRSSVVIEVRRRKGGTKDGKLDWYLEVDGVKGKPIRSFVNIESRV